MYGLKYVMYAGPIIAELFRMIKVSTDVFEIFVVLIRGKRN